MNIREWHRLRRLIHDQFYEDLVTAADCGAFDGGCLVVAQALHRVIGGQLVVLVRDTDIADHAAVWKDGKLWDYDGPMVPSLFIQRFNRTEARHTPWSAVGFRSIQAEDLPDAHREDALTSRLADLFRQMLPQSGHQIDRSIENASISVPR
jgi:hypothetical protein